MGRGDCRPTRRPPGRFCGALLSTGEGGPSSGDQTKYRWVNQYNFYLQDAEWGPMCVRVCPYFPFSTRICLNQHPWLTHQMKPAGIRFQQSGNAFRRCSDPEVLQKIADSLTSDDLIRCGHKGLRRWIPSSMPKNGVQRAAGTRCSFPKSSTVTI